jgi:hypothetical protein
MLRTDYGLVSVCIVPLNNIFLVLVFGRINMDRLGFFGEAAEGTLGS